MSTRTANYILLTDCAFLFFRGLQLRVWDPEIQCDLPCHEDVFDAVHPFTHPNFSFKRPLTAQQAFVALFATGRAEPECNTGLTMLDSFVLIHSKLSLLIQGCALHEDLPTANLALQCSIDSSMRPSQYSCLDRSPRKKCSTLTAL